MLSKNIYATNDGADGSIRYIHNVWATARGAATGESVDANYLTVNSSLSAGSYFIQRGFTSFNLSSIPVGSRIVSVSLNIYVSISSNDDGDSIYICPATQSASLSVNDYNNFSYTDEGHATIAGMSAGWNAIALNATGIALVISKLNSSMKIVLISGRDFSNNAPSGGNSVIPESAGSGYPPYLAIGYIPPAASMIIG